MSSGESKDAVRNVVLLVPGIRDYGNWTEKAKREVFDKIPNCKVFRVGLDYYDALRFLARKDVSQQAYEKLVGQYQSVSNAYPSARISIVAHSFGTYLVGRLLQEYKCERLNRVILCGSVLPRGYDWDNVRHRFGSDECVLNECGYSDKWPIRAGILRSNRYGAAGVYGFEQVYPENRWYYGGHNLFFRVPHMKNWPPFLFDQKTPESVATVPLPGLFERFCSTIPQTASLLGVLLSMICFVLARLYLFLGLALIVFVTLLIWFFYPVKTIEAQAFYEEWRANSTQYMNQEWVLKDGKLRGKCKMYDNYEPVSAFKLHWPAGSVDSKYGCISVTPSVPIGKKFLSGKNLRFEGKIVSVTDFLGVHVDDAVVEVVD